MFVRQRATTPLLRSAQRCWSSGSNNDGGAADAVASVADLWIDHPDGNSAVWMETFREHYLRQEPVLLRQLAREFPALERWKSLDYLEAAVGPEVTCDCEVGGTYNDSARLTLPFGEYLTYLRLWDETYGSSGTDDVPSDHLLYLAQNDLSGFGNLSGDVRVPVFCTDPTGSFGSGRLYNTMFWMGPRGSVSPLHHDPLDNVLMQMVGRKRVVLIPPTADPSCLYVGEVHGQQPNTSAVNDAEHPDTTRFPLYPPLLAQEGQVAFLEPGDALFIPSRWWHHVRSLDLSISVNAWWR